MKIAPVPHAAKAFFGQERREEKAKGDWRGHISISNIRADAEEEEEEEDGCGAWNRQGAPLVSILYMASASKKKEELGPLFFAHNVRFACMVRGCRKIREKGVRMW